MDRIHQRKSPQLRHAPAANETEEEYTGKTLAPPPFQLMATDATPPSDASAATPPAANNTGLPDNLKGGMENLSGVSLDDVKVHFNSDKPAQMQAHAYAQGTDIHVAPGQEQHLPHEAWHVVQQKQGRVQATRQLKGKVAINDDAGLEKEADVMGAKALQTAENPAYSVIQNKKITESAGIAQRAVIQRANTIVDDPNDKKNKKEPGKGRGLLRESNGNINEWVRFGGLLNDCGTSMNAMIMPTDDEWGTAPKAGTWPDWWATYGPSNTAYWVRGHLLNHNLGGPGEKRNLTPITKKCNSQHHSLVEKAAKAAYANNCMLGYTVSPQYNGVGPTNLFGDNTDPDQAAWSMITTGFQCSMVMIDDQGVHKGTINRFIENKR
ncbi:MAG TPA: DUF4157 domain-containing protein [Bacteroidetes bacterium]|nr:DUF4157 domain-containing protein [Bacteroidota bacterium]